MDTLLATPSLAEVSDEVLAKRIDVVGRLGVEGRRPWDRNKRHRIDQVTAEVRAAMASGERAALKAALASVDLLSLELCEV